MEKNRGIIAWAAVLPLVCVSLTAHAATSGKAGTYSLPAGKTLQTVSLGDVTKTAISTCSNKTFPAGSYPDQAADVTTGDLETEEDVMKEKEIVAARCVSEYESIILEDKRAALGDAGSLTYDEEKRIQEIRSGIACGADTESKASEIKSGAMQVGCLSDIRLYRFLMRKTFPVAAYSPLSESVDAMQQTWSKSVGNSIIYFMSFAASVAGFGMEGFDKLPPLPYSSKDLFDSKTFVGKINLSALTAVALLILFFFYRKASSRSEDDYKTFAAKVAVVLALTMGFPAFYGNLWDVSQKIDSSFIAAFSDVIDRGVIERGISPTVFQTGVIDTVTWLTFLFWLPNFLGLIAISVTIILRNLFLQFVSYVFFVFAIGLLAWTLRKDNALEANDAAGKATRKLVLGMFWAISLFVSIVASTVLFKILAVFLWFVNSVEVNGKTVLGNIGAFGIDAFVYIAAIVGVLFVWYKWLLPATFGVVSGFMTGIFMPQAQRLSSGDFFTELADAHQKIRLEYDDARMNNPEFLAHASPVQEAVSGAFGAAKEKSAMARKILEHPALSDEQGIVRRALKTTAVLATWIGDTAALTAQLERRREIAKVDAEMVRLKSELSGLDEGDPETADGRRKLATRIEVLETRKAALFAEYENRMAAKEAERFEKKAEKAASAAGRAENPEARQELRKTAVSHKLSALEKEAEIESRSAWAEIAAIDLSAKPARVRADDGNAGAADRLEELKESRKTAEGREAEAGERMSKIREAKAALKTAEIPETSGNGTGEPEWSAEAGEEPVPERKSAPKKPIELPPSLATRPNAPAAREPATEPVRETVTDEEDFAKAVSAAVAAGRKPEFRDFRPGNAVAAEILRNHVSTFWSISWVEESIEEEFRRISSSRPEKSQDPKEAPEPVPTVTPPAGDVKTSNIDGRNP